MNAHHANETIGTWQERFFGHENNMRTEHAAKQDQEAGIVVWDPLVRIFHWGLVLMVTLAFLTEDDFMFLHVLAGYLILGLVIFRLIWGVMGTYHARFQTFVHGPRRILGYLSTILRGQPEHHVGHNPAGGGMVVAILLVLLVTALLGMATFAAKEFQGPVWLLAAGLGTMTVKTLETLHELFANLLLILVALHVTGVVVAMVQHRENLLKSMFTGRKRAVPVPAMILILGLMIGFPTRTVHAATLDDILATYRTQGGQAFSAQKGEELLNRPVKDPEGGADRTCATCHTRNPKQRGQHPKTGKPIEPLAPAANPERLTDAAKVEKWFGRNCEWTLGRACTPQEKGDFLTYLKSL
ncbi:MAG: DUF1924 domain-containing protein [Magnetococcus sp. DMHC-1]|nr:DUF1924 domain-containing protein [Magnetococcales bacterium]